MGIALTAFVIVALLIVARAALRGYQDEDRKAPEPVHPDSSLDLVLLSPEGSSGVSSHGHATHHADPGCADTHHPGCDAGGHGGFDGGYGGYGGHH